MARIAHRRTENVEERSTSIRPASTATCAGRSRHGVSNRRGTSRRCVISRRMLPTGRLPSKPWWACPVGSIGAVGRQDLRPAIAAYPKPIEPGVSFCGFAASASFGASSYLIERARATSSSIARASRRSSFVASSSGRRAHDLPHAPRRRRRSRSVGTPLRRRAHPASRRLQPALRIDRAPSRRCGQALAGRGSRCDSDARAHARAHRAPVREPLSIQRRSPLVVAAPPASGGLAFGVLGFVGRSDRSMERLLGERFEWVLPGHGWRYQAPATSCSPNSEPASRRCDGDES
jgi:hypothetical protein